MNDKEIRALLSTGSTQHFTLDPNMKNEITRETLDVAIRDVKRALSAKKHVSVVIVTE